MQRYPLLLAIQPLPYLGQHRAYVAVLVAAEPPADKILSVFELNQPMVLEIRHLTERNLGIRIEPKNNTQNYEMYKMVHSKAQRKEQTLRCA